MGFFSRLIKFRSFESLPEGGKAVTYNLEELEKLNRESILKMSTEELEEKSTEFRSAVAGEKNDIIKRELLEKEAEVNAELRYRRQQFKKAA